MMFKFAILTGYLALVRHSNMPSLSVFFGHSSIFFAKYFGKHNVVTFFNSVCLNLKTLKAFA